MPSLTPLASLYAPIPLSGVFVALFAVEQLINGWRHGFAGDEARHGDEPAAEELDLGL
jgi:TRAP-type C4-dicarboxylate transport system permease small subunit